MAECLPAIKENNSTSQYDYPHTENHFNIIKKMKNFRDNVGGIFRLLAFFNSLKMLSLLFMGIIEKFACQKSVNNGQDENQAGSKVKWSLLNSVGENCPYTLKMRVVIAVKCRREIACCSNGCHYRVWQRHWRK